ncbi:MAG TPA: ankyrin repeat domain-containing protein [Methylomirabilota bacterium]|nr:ankyrin repeat domain-containing protein [Methylomirabilota bacterium]
MTPLISSALLGYLDIARVLLAHGADVNAVSGTMGSALHAVVSSERPEAVQMIELLAAHGAAVNALDDLGETPLWTAVSRRAGNRLMMEALLRAGADANVVARGRSLLHEAVEKETAETVSLLLRHGADRALTDEAGASALDLARELGREEIARLLERGEPSRG